MSRRSGRPSTASSVTTCRRGIGRTLRATARSVSELITRPGALAAQPCRHVHSALSRRLNLGESHDPVAALNCQAILAIGVYIDHLADSCGLGAILGPLLAGVFKDAATGGNTPVGWMTPFLIAGVACLIGALIMLFTEAPGTRRGRGRGRIGGMATGKT